MGVGNGPAAAAARFARAGGVEPGGRGDSAPRGMDPGEPGRIPGVPRIQGKP